MISRFLKKFNFSRIIFRVRRGFVTVGLPLAFSAITACAQICVAPPSGLVSAWQAEGDASDSKGINSGTVSGGLLFGNGEVGQAFQFNGTSASVSVAASTSLNVGLAAGFTFEAWIKPADLVSQRALMEWNNGSGGLGAHFWINQPTPGAGAGCLFANIIDTNGNFHYLGSVSGLLVTNAYQHVALTYDLATGFAAIYRNGTVVASQYLGTFTPQTSFNIFLGTRASGAAAGSFYVGGMDEPALYNRALSQTEIISIYSAGTLGKCGFAPSSVSIQPQNQTVDAGESATLVAVADGSRPLSYQWSFGSMILPSATNSSLMLSNLNVTNSGTYSVTVSNGFGSTNGTASLSVVQTTCTAPPSGLVAWWRAGGNALDFTGTNNGSIQGSVTFPAGKVGSGFQFSGGYILVPASAGLDVATGLGVTIETWIKPVDLLSQRPLLDWNDNGFEGAHFWINTLPPEGNGSGCIYANIIDTAGSYHYLASAAGILLTNFYQHVALTYDKASGLAKLYRNGSVVASQNLGSFTPRTGLTLNIGARPFGGFLYSGAMDEVAVYNRALTSNEIQSISSAGSSGKCVPLPTISTQPQSRTVVAGNDTVFNLVATGAAPFSYQWQFNTTNIPGATNSSFAIIGVQMTNAGNYMAIVSNDGGATPSSNALLTVITPTCVTLPSNTVAWWQAEGSTLDSAGLNPGTAQGNLTYTNGKVGLAMKFDGVNSYVSVAASSTLNVGTNTGMTIEAWIKPADLANETLVEWNNGLGGVGPHFWINQPNPSGTGPGSLFANIVDTNGGFHTIASPPNLVSTNVFSHLALTYNKVTGVATLYVNGTSVVSQNMGIFTPLTTYNLYLGRRISGGISGNFRGLMDEVSIYGRALSASEILALYNAATLGRCGVAPIVKSHPQNQTVAVGANATFTASVAGSQPLVYQWQRNSSTVVGTNASLTLSNVQPSIAGNYSLFVTNNFGSTNSSNALLKVNVVTVKGNNQTLTNAQYTFGDSVTIQLLNVYSNGNIYYTLDGSEPNIFSPQYSAPFVLTSSKIIRALGYKADFSEFAQTDPITITILPIYSLTTTTAGGGTISLNPPGGSYISNSVVTARATPTAGWTFLQWLGDASGTNTNAVVTVNRNQSVRAVFGTSLLTSSAPANSGSLLLNPPGGFYPYGTTVLLSALPQPGYFFGVWGTAGSGSANPLAFVLTNANPTISSLFVSLGVNQAALAVVPTGRGTVNVNPATNIFTIGQQAQVTAISEAGQSFVGWNGDATGTQNPLTVTMSQSKIIYANFTKSDQLTFQPLALRPLSEGFQLTLTGEFGVVYRLDGSSNLFDWAPLVTNSNSFGVLQYIDLRSATNPVQYYRGVPLP